jgi:hypothetical protein
VSGDDFAPVRERLDPVAPVESLTHARAKHRSPDDARHAPCPFRGSKAAFTVNPRTKA